MVYSHTLTGRWTKTVVDVRCDCGCSFSFCRELMLAGSVAACPKCGNQEFQAENIIRVVVSPLEI